MSRDTVDIDEPGTFVAPPESVAAVLKVDNVTKRYEDSSGSLEVLQDFSFTVPRGGAVSLVGPTGCGKTTALRIIAGVEQPTTGSVSFDDALLHLNRQRISMVFQQHTLLGWRTLRENISLPLELAGENLREWHSEIHEVIAAVGLTGFENYRPNRMSGGMQARAALARALVQRPSITLLDEPFASIDEIRRATMMQLLVKLFAEYKTASVLVTHSVYEAAFLSDVVLVLSARPATIIGRVHISMPKEQRLAEPDHDDLIVARAEIRRLLKEGQQPLI
jgi:NitT/TauT family transport system ATP-binding protein